MACLTTQTQAPQVLTERTLSAQNLCVQDGGSRAAC